MGGGWWQDTPPYTCTQTKSYPFNTKRSGQAPVHTLQVKSKLRVQCWQQGPIWYTGLHLHCVIGSETSSTPFSELDSHPFHTLMLPQQWFLCPRYSLTLVFNFHSPLLSSPSHQSPFIHPLHVSERHQNLWLYLSFSSLTIPVLIRTASSLLIITICFTVGIPLKHTPSILLKHLISNTCQFFHAKNV